MSDSNASYLRCCHCKGFYETSFSRCKWCEYDAPVLSDAGEPRVFAGRDDCRAIQLAEYHRLPPEAHEDSMGPPREDLTLLCNCLHCGPAGHTFEAVEMRWMLTERMWACPCTTCGGRGFGIDIHSAEYKWECAECGHFYLPPNRDYRSSNARCPRCGSTSANGWFDDEDDDEEDEDDLLNGNESADASPTARELWTDEELPWDDDEDDDDGDGPGRYDLGITWKESEAEDDFFTPEGDGADAPFARRDRLPDDIDFPHYREDCDPDVKDNDIPF
jgi:DNA-directed RNA polymerase subunit RPC12/RpoP